MDRSLFILSIIQAIGDVIRVKKEHEITIQDLHQANDFMQEVVKNQEDFVQLMQEISVVTQSLNQTERQKIYRCIAKIYRNMIEFDEECIRIVNSRKKGA